MALNTNHTFEELGDTKCAIVEKNSSPARVSFLKKLLEHNQFKVVVVNSPPPKVPAKPVVAANGEPVPAAAPAPETFTVGVTDLSFNPMNAIFNRELKTPGGKIVSPDYWKQLISEPEEEVWYWK